jgi:biopolymer transport protein ExbD
MAGFNINLGFLMNLPAKDSTRLILRDDLMRFEMDSGGNLAYQGAEMSLAGAEREIRAAIAGHPNLAVVLSIDGEAPWQQVVLFVELAQKLRVDSFSFNIKESS